MQHWQSNITFSLALGLVMATNVSTAQWSDAMDPRQIEWDRAMEAFENNQFALALHAFETLADEEDPASEAYVTATYYAAMSSMSLYHKDASYRIESFVKRFPESPLALEARWELANHHYKRRNYSKAIEQFLEIRPRELSKERRDEYRFKLGHCHFEREQYEEARVQLFEVLEVAGDFQAPAQYYFAHIAYLNGQPQVALDGFQRIAQEPGFSELVPLYIAQLLHATGQYDELKTYAPSLLDAASGLTEESRAEVSRLLGDAWYREGNYEEAALHLNAAWDSPIGPEHTPDFAYQVGHTRQQLEQHEAALPCFAVASREENELAQHAAYRIADCYLQLGDKARAKQAFKTASQYEFDRDIQEDAFFHYAKLSYEVSFNPLDDALVAFERYLEQFPSSTRRDEAYRFLLQVHMTSRDYERALQALSNIEDPDQTVQSAAQVLAFNRAVELFQNKQLARSLEFFKRSRASNVDPQLHAETFYWEGEILFNQGKYPEAAAAFAKFSTTPGSYLSPLHNDANYARGYAHFKSEKYTDALSAFRSYIEAKPKDQSRMRDAELRAADCFYALKGFDQAADYYDRVLAREVRPLDYALFQRAMSAKFDGDPQGQTSRMDQLLANHPKSRLVVEALYQGAKTHIEEEELEAAKAKLNRLLDEFPATPRAKDALVEMCLVGIKQGDEDLVLSTWDRIRTDYGNDDVAADAFNIVEPLLIERGLLDNLPSAVGLDGAAIEQRVFESASYLALENKCTEALPRLQEYLRQYPAGLHVAEAQFYLGNCAFEADQLEQAYNAYTAVLALPAGEFSEPSALGAATLAWNNGDHSAALSHYEYLEAVAVLQSNRLEAYIGQMRCHYLLGQEDEAVEFATKVMNDPATPSDIMRTAQLWNARIACNKGNHQAVLDDLNLLVTYGGSAGAEAQYLIAESHYNANNFETCEAELFSLIEKFYNQELWKNKGFLLLVQTYIGMNDLFQARATAESILANVSAPNVQEAVSDLLFEIDALESAEVESTPDNTPETDEE